MIDIDSTFQLRIKNPLTVDLIAEILWTVPTESSYFEGHFPGRPILPAIAIVDACKKAAQELHKQELRLTKINHAKFGAPVIPGMQIQIVVQKKDDRTWSFEWKEVLADQAPKNLAQLSLVLDLATASAART